jgi:hypothetical protein
MEEEFMIGCCGIKCSECGAFLATKNDDDAKRAEVAAEWSKMVDADIKAEQSGCNGCNSEGPWFHYCENICEIRKCCKEKGHGTCAGCDEFACERLKGFFGQVPDAQKNLEALR